MQSLHSKSLPYHSIGSQKGGKKKLMLEPLRNSSIGSALIIYSVWLLISQN